MQAAGIGLAGTSQIQGSAMVNRGTDNGQAQRDIDGPAKALEFQYRQALVVIHGQYRISIVEPVRGEQGVRRQRPGQLNSLGPQLFEGRLDHLDFLPAQMAPFTGVRIQAGHQNARLINTEKGFQVGIQNARHLSQPFRCNGCGDVFQG